MFYGDVSHFKLFARQMFQRLSKDQLKSVEFEIVENQKYSGVSKYQKYSRKREKIERYR